MDYEVANLPENEQQDGIDNIFDSVFRTIVEYLPWLIIPLINEVFGLMFRIDEPLRVLKNEHMTWGGKLITDMLFEIQDRRFHVECQSSPDGRMIIRVMEYAAAIAIGNVIEEADGSFCMEFPSSCVIYLRSTKNTPDFLTMKVRFPNREVLAYEVPLLKVQEYSKDALFEKNLLMLLPYYLMRYEKECRAIDKDCNAADQSGNSASEEKMAVFYAECEDIIQRLAKVCEKQEEQYLYQTLAELIIAVAVYLAPKKEKGRAKEMGGHVIKTSAQKLVEQGELKNLVRQICKKIIKGKTLEAIAEELEEDVESIRHIYETALTHAPKYDVDEIVNELLPEDSKVAV